MTVDCEELFRREKRAFGEPTKIVDFFERLGIDNADILDVGCGQGRDALFLARSGHRVTATDIAPTGIKDLQREAAAEGLEINAVVADIRDYESTDTFDVVLIDRTLHMLAKPEQVAVLERLIRCVRPNGFVMIADEPSNIAAFVAVLERSGQSWVTKLKRHGYLFAQRGP